MDLGFQRGPAPRRAVVGPVAAILLTVFFTASVAWPSTGSEPAAGSAPPPQTDAMDVLRKVLHKEPTAQDSVEAVSYGKRALLVTPFLNYDPVTSVIFGVGLLTSIFRGDPQSTFPSTVQAGASISLEEQISVGTKFDAYTNGNRWFFQANAAWAKYPQSVYSLGTDSPDSSKLGVDLYIPKILLSAYHQVLPDLFAGIGLHYVTRTDIRPMGKAGPRWDQSAFVQYSRDSGLDLKTQTSAGLSGNVLIDRRDNPVNASRGWFANASYRSFFKDLLGGSSNWQEVYLDLRTYGSLDLNGRHRLALWLYGDVVAGGVAPFFDLPATGSVPRGRAGRGYDGNRFRGDRMAYAELEYRVTLTRNGLLGAVAFVNTESFGTPEAGGEDLLDNYATGFGMGLRILVDKRAKSNLCLDVGFGEDGSRGIWAGFQETF